MKYFLLLLLFFSGCYHERGRSYLGAEEFLVDSHAVPLKPSKKRKVKQAAVYIGLEDQPLETLPVLRARSLKLAVLAVVSADKLGPLSRIKIERGDVTYLLKWKEVDALDPSSLLLLPGDVCTIYLKTVRQ